MNQKRLFVLGVILTGIAGATGVYSLRQTPVRDELKHGAAASSSSTSSKGKEFRFRLLGEPETLDWNRAHTSVETYILMNLMEGLLKVDHKLNVKGALARSWKKSDDGLTYTFELRPGVLWSDGVELKAKDFVYSWKRLLSPVTAASYAYLMFDIVNAERFFKGEEKDFSKVGIKTLGPYRIQVKLKKPVAHWKYIPTFWVTFPLREDIVKKYGEGWATPGRMVTLGPYTYASHAIDSKLVLKANAKYYGKRGNVETIIARIVRNDTTAVQLFETGKLDFTSDLTPVDVQRLKGNPALKTFPYLKTVYLGLVAKKYPMTNPRIRRAIAMAINKAEIRKILAGGQTRAGSFLPLGMKGHNANRGLPFDPKRAKIELQRAGFDGTQKLKIELVVPNWDKPLTVAQFIQQQLKKHLGIEVSIQPYDHKTFRAQIDLHVFDMFILSWAADYPDADNFLSVWMSDSGNNRTVWKDPRYDGLVKEIRVEQRPTRRLKKIAQAEKILLEEGAAIVPLYYDPNVVLVSDRVKGFKLNPMNYVYIKDVWVR